MFKTIKTFSFLALLSFLFINYSCIEEEETRTLTMELEELDELLSGLEAEGHNIDTTESGVYYILDDNGDGITPMPGDTVSITYAGYYIDGTMFDASSDAWEFVYMEQSLIEGFNDALGVLSKGAQVDCFIPSRLGYGEDGSGIMPPYTTLWFTVVMQDLKPL